MTSPQMRPSRPREPRPELVAAIARRNRIRALKNEIKQLEAEANKIRQRLGPGDRLDRVLDQLAPLYRQQKENR